MILTYVLCMYTHTSIQYNVVVDPGFWDIGNKPESETTGSSGCLLLAPCNRNVFNLDNGTVLVQLKCFNLTILLRRGRYIEKKKPTRHKLRNVYYSNLFTCYFLYHSTEIIVKRTNVFLMTSLNRSKVCFIFFLFFFFLESSFFILTIQDSQMFAYC